MRQNHTFDIFSQMAPTWMFVKLLGGSRKCMPARDIVEMATIEGAKVLGLDAKVGSLEVGKCADLVRISLDSPRMTPIYDIYAANSSDVRDVMINGNWVAKNGVALTIERAKVMQDALQISENFGQTIKSIDANT